VTTDVSSSYVQNPQRELPFCLIERFFQELLMRTIFLAIFVTQKWVEGERLIAPLVPPSNDTDSMFLPSPNLNYPSNQTHLTSNFHPLKSTKF
jgi:hypothetical protein